MGWVKAGDHVFNLDDVIAIRGFDTVDEEMRMREYRVTVYLKSGSAFDLCDPHASAVRQMFLAKIGSLTDVGAVQVNKAGPAS